MIVTVNQKVYQMGPGLFDSLVETAREKFKKAKQCAIVAVGSGEVWVLDNKVFPDKKSLDNAVGQIRRRGLKVKTVRG